ncbi:MAG: methyl-accepting chemotaxis protein [Spirochaetia bacterium]|nr:methyl-accepting chemotaxis protein [Spirochaetia bacterium]
MSIRARVLALMILGLAGTGVVAAIVLTASYKAQRGYMEDTPPLDALQRTQLLATEGHLWFEELITGDNTNKIETIEDLWKKGEALCEVMLTGGEMDGVHYIALEDPRIRAGVEKTRTGLQALQRSGRERLSGAQSTGSDADQKFDAIYQAVMENSDESARILRTRLGVSQDLVATFAWLLPVLVIIISVIILFAGLAIRVSITKPIEDLTRRFQDLAEGEGDLTHRMNAEGNHEFATMAAYLNKFLNAVHETVAGIKETAIQTESAASSLATVSENLSSGTEEMSMQTEAIAGLMQQLGANLEVISSSVQQMSVSIADVARMTAEAASSARQANQNAQKSTFAVEELGNNARQIGQIIGDIADIADQTNLLALNAAIEAAGAGTEGRRFAVVAQEVKQLAKQSSSSSDSTKQRLESIQESTAIAQSAMTAIQHLVGSVNELNTAVASAMEEQSIASRQIASGSTEAATTSTEIGKNIVAISIVVRSEAKEAAGMAQLAASLRDQAGALRIRLDRFKV